MSKSLRGHLALLMVLVALKLSIGSIAEQKSMDNQVNFPNDFLIFLKGLGNKSMKTKSTSPSTTPKMINIWGSDKGNMNSQKAAFKDVLMMKLVSYYEDKYKLTNHKPMAAVNPVNKYSYNYTSKVKWNSLPASVFPEQYKLRDYKAKSNDPEEIYSDAEVLIL